MSRRRSGAPLAAAFAAAMALAPCPQASAQTVLERAVVQARRTCDGDTITAVDIQARAPLTAGITGTARRRASSLLGLSYTPTRPTVIAAYLRLTSGTPCSELNRSESERLLRAQPFIASAVITPVSDGPGRVRMRVDVVDELRLTGDASVRRGSLSSIGLGSENLSGRGLAISLGARRGFAYRDGFGAQAVKYGMFGRPDFLAVAAERRAVIGEHLFIELAEPFLTDLQRRAVHSSASLLSGYTTLLRPEGAPASIFVRRTSYDVGLVRRRGRASERGAIGLFGAVLLGEDVRTGAELLVLADSGPAPIGPSPFGMDYPAFTTTRVAAIVGVRALRFIRVDGFDAVRAEQDMGIGTQLDVLAGPSLQASAGAADFFVAADLYAGAGNERSFVVARALSEARKDRSSQDWDGVVMSGRLAWYRRPAFTQTFKATLEYSAVRRLVFPMQLTLRDPDGGLSGYGDATAAGGRRLIARVEQRRLLRSPGSRADLALAGFLAAGKLWAGDVPYGRTTPMLGSVGVSLLGAYPAGGKRTYRLDVAMPFSPGIAGSRVEVRLSSADRTRLVWLEPNEVARARTGAVPASLMKW